MAADADTTTREMSNTETSERSSIEEEPLLDPDSSTAGQAQDADDYDAAAKPVRRRRPSMRLATLVSLVIVLIVAGLVGWLGLRTYQSRQAQEQRELFLQVGRQGAVNLTTIDWKNVDHDIQRILDSATGKFYDDFSQRSQPFVDLVKKVQSTSVGTVTESGLESMSDNDAQVLVAVSVTTSNLGAADQPPQGWRMRLDVQKIDGGAKVSNVSFVPA